jgi:hypothetical protein
MTLGVSEKKCYQYWITWYVLMFEPQMYFSVHKILINTLLIMTSKYELRSFDVFLFSSFTVFSVWIANYSLNFILQQKCEFMFKNFDVHKNYVYLYLEMLLKKYVFIVLD